MKDEQVEILARIIWDEKEARASGIDAGRRKRPWEEARLHEVLEIRAIARAVALMLRSNSEIDAIEARVRPTVCETHSARGMTIEGRISRADFDALLAAARFGAMGART